MRFPMTDIFIFSKLSQFRIGKFTLYKFSNLIQVWFELINISVMTNNQAHQNTAVDVLDDY
jgi:hypothetical protein